MDCKETQILRIAELNLVAKMFCSLWRLQAEDKPELKERHIAAVDGALSILEFVYPDIWISLSDRERVQLQESATWKEPEEGYYTYALIDPEDNLVFYIGKGKGGTGRGESHALQHTDMNAPKNAVISKIKDRGQLPRVAYIGKFENERDAYSHESFLIGKYPELTNISGNKNKSSMFRLFDAMRSSLAEGNYLQAGLHGMQNPCFVEELRRVHEELNNGTTD